MYKGVGKEQRDKVQLMAAEKKARQEVEDLKSQVLTCHSLTGVGNFCNLYTFITMTEYILADFKIHA